MVSMVSALYDLCTIAMFLKYLQSNLNVTEVSDINNGIRETSAFPHKTKE